MTVTGANHDVLKEVFGKFTDAIPDWRVIGNDIPFEQRAKLGKSYDVSVRLRRAHGVTLASGATSLTAFSMNDPVSALIDRATVSGSMLIAREAFAYKMVEAALAEGKQAFIDVAGEGIADLFNTSGFYLEAFMLYGQTSFGAFAADGTNNATQDIALTAASSAPGLWAQMEGAYVDIYSDTTFGTKRNSSNTVEITGIDFSTATGQVTLSLSGNATELDAVVAGDIVVPRGFYSSGHMTLAGLDKIVTNTGSLFGINAGTYPIWAGNTAAAGSAALTFAKITSAAVQITVRCPPMEEALKVYVSPMTWVDLNDNEAALRRYTDTAGGTVKQGAKRITYYSVTGSMVEIVPHPMVKGGECFLGFPSTAVRGGVAEPNFSGTQTSPGGEPNYMVQLASTAGYEVRNWWDQFLLLQKPRAWVKMTGIVNTKAA